MKRFSYLLLLSPFLVAGCTIPDYAQGLVKATTDGLVMVLTAGVSVAFVYLSNFIKSKTQGQKLETALVGITEYVESVAGNVINKNKESLAEILQDGVVTAEERAKLVSETMDILKSYVTPDKLKDLASGLGLSKEMALEFLKEKVSEYIGNVAQYKVGEVTSTRQMARSGFYERSMGYPISMPVKKLSTTSKTKTTKKAKRK